MSYLEKGRVWIDYLNNVDKSINRLAVINQTCEDSIKMMYMIHKSVGDAILQTWGRRQLPNAQVFVLAFYERNISYLQSAYVLASIGFVSPSANIARTVFETLLRQYLLIVDKKEANEYFQVIGTLREDSYHMTKGVKYMREKLYIDSTSQKMKKLYSLLSTYSHPDIKGTRLNFPNYSSKFIDDIMRTNLLLMYGNIEVFTEAFYSLLDNSSKEYIKKTLENIAFNTGRALALEPDKPPYGQLIKLKNGNFNQLL